MFICRITVRAQFSLKSATSCQTVHKNKLLIHYPTVDDIGGLTRTFPAFTRKSDTFTKTDLTVELMRTQSSESLKYLKEDRWCDLLHFFFSDRGGKECID